MSAGERREPALAGSMHGAAAAFDASMKVVDAQAVPALAIHDLEAWYGESHILHGVEMTVGRGEVVTLLGRNGAGRSTTLRAIMGLTGRRRGSIRIAGRETIALPTHRIAHGGVGYCPEERGIFSSLSCEENLLLPPAVGPRENAMSLDEIYTLFPNLATRRHSQGTRLSGGEQQMLAVARILRTGANLLLLDEISEGLAPVIVQTLARMIVALKARGYTIVMVEQNFRFAAPLADRFYVMEHGRIVEHFEAAQLEGKMPVLHALLGV
ncbi:ABC transporter ATP-binding protein [Burkholderia sp. 3C]